MAPPHLVGGKSKAKSKSKPKSQSKSKKPSRLSSTPPFNASKAFARSDDQMKPPGAQNRDQSPRDTIVHEAGQAAKVSKKVRQRGGRSLSRGKQLRGQKILALQSAQRAADRETSQPSRLLTLPAELRTEIFALALEDTDYINITEQLKPPGLLSACRQVREETWPIWISQNRFFLHLHGFDHRLFSKWYKLVGGVDPAGITVGMIFDNVYDWENLLRWCRAEHADQSVNVPATEDGDVVDGSLTSYAVAYGALAIAHGMSGTPWPTCEFVLRKFRFALSCAGVEWE